MPQISFRGRGLSVHRVHRNQQPHLPEGAENFSHTRDFVALLGDDELAEHDTGESSARRIGTALGSYQAPTPTNEVSAIHKIAKFPTQT